MNYIVSSSPISKNFSFKSGINRKRCLFKITPLIGRCFRLNSIKIMKPSTPANNLIHPHTHLWKYLNNHHLIKFIHPIQHMHVIFPRGSPYVKRGTHNSNTSKIITCEVLCTAYFNMYQRSIKGVYSI